jgi:hypothetical protein
MYIYYIALSCGGREIELLDMHFDGSDKDKSSGTYISAGLLYVKTTTFILIFRYVTHSLYIIHIEYNYE